MDVSARNPRPHDLIGRLVAMAPLAADGSLSDKADRAALAALRRGLGKEPGTAPEMFPYVEPTLTEDAGRELVEASYLVASLFGAHPRHRDSPSESARDRRGFGATLSAIRFRDGEEDAGLARRFVATLDAPRSSLPTHLRHLCALLDARAPGTPIDFRQLFRDLRDWDRPTRIVQRSWASGFWRTHPATGTGVTEPPASSSTEEG